MKRGCIYKKVGRKSNINKRDYFRVCKYLNRDINTSKRLN